MRRKEERSKQGQTNNKAKQHSTPTAVTLPKKNELPRMGQYVYVHVYTRVQVGWTAVVSAVVWQRMLKILGDVNAISDPAIHHLAFLKLLGIWRLLEEVRRGGEGGGGRGEGGRSMYVNRTVTMCKY